MRPPTAGRRKVDRRRLDARTATAASRQMLNKVPQVTVWFWIIKVMATTVGETGADLLDRQPQSRADRDLAGS